MLEPNRRQEIGGTILDYSKIFFASLLATGFFAGFPASIRIVLFFVLVVLFLVGWAALPAKKDG